jgi:hypothetical protein
MSLCPTLDADVRIETAVIARDPSPRGHAYLGLRDALDPI